MRLLADEIESSVATLSRSRNTPGLFALQRLANQQAAEAYANFETQWAGGRATQFLSRAEELGRNLGAENGGGTAAAAVPPLKVSGPSGNGRSLAYSSSTSAPAAKAASLIPDSPS